MSTLMERIIDGQKLGVEKIKRTDPCVGWFLAAAHFFPDGGIGEPSSVHVLAHFRSWMRYFEPETFRDLSVEEIADLLIAWIVQAMDGQFLVADDPPMRRAPGPPAKLVDLMQARLKELRAEAEQTGA